MSDNMLEINLKSSFDSEFRDVRFVKVVSSPVEINTKDSKVSESDIFNSETVFKINLLIWRRIFPVFKINIF